MELNFLVQNGFKLSDDQENEIEQLLDQTNPDLPTSRRGYVHYSDYFEGAQKYLSYLKSTVDVNFEGLKIVIRWCKRVNFFFSPILVWRFRSGY